jgi:C4-dicarboxylate-specific signal transduction histidine kinase
VLRGQPASWEIAPDYLGFALHQLLLNSLEAYRRRALPLPTQPVTLTIDYNASSILLNDAAGGISPHISDPFLPYLSEKGVHMKAGLGLLQARAAIEALDGALTLDPSQPKHGAAFLIQLPHTS